MLPVVTKVMLQNVYFFLFLYFYLRFGEVNHVLNESRRTAPDLQGYVKVIQGRVLLN